MPPPKRVVKVSVKTSLTCWKVATKRSVQVASISRMVSSSESQRLHEILALVREKLRSLLEFVDLLEGEQIDRAETFELGAEALDIGAQGLRFIVWFRFRFEQRLDREAELVRCMLSEAIPVGFGAGLLDLDGVQDVSFPSWVSRRSADLFFELGRPGR